jgi:hypothetical protein
MRVKCSESGHIAAGWLRIDSGYYLTLLRMADRSRKAIMRIRQTESISSAIRLHIFKEVTYPMLVPNMMAKKNRMTFTMNVSQKMIFIWVDFPLPGRSIGHTDFL